MREPNRPLQWSELLMLLVFVVTLFVVVFFGTGRKVACRPTPSGFVCPTS